MASLSAALYLLLCIDQANGKATDNADCLSFAIDADHDQSLSLSWKHSVEKSQWIETYRFNALQFHLVKVKIQGSGAGMEIPADAVLEDNYYVHYPNLSLDALTLTYSPFTEDYTICIQQDCRFLLDWLQKDSYKSSSLFINQDHTYVAQFKLSRFP